MASRSRVAMSLKLWSYLISLSTFWGVFWGNQVCGSEALRLWSGEIATAWTASKCSDRTCWHSRVSTSQIRAVQSSEPETRYWLSADKAKLVTADWCPTSVAWHSPWDVPQILIFPSMDAVNTWLLRKITSSTELLAALNTSPSRSCGARTRPSKTSFTAVPAPTCGRICCSRARTVSLLWAWIVFRLDPEMAQRISTFNRPLLGRCICGEKTEKKTWPMKEKQVESIMTMCWFYKNSGRCMKMVRNTTTSCILAPEHVHLAGCLRCFDVWRLAQTRSCLRSHKLWKITIFYQISPFLWAIFHCFFRFPVGKPPLWGLVLIPDGEWDTPFWMRHIILKQQLLEHPIRQSHDIIW